jgi:hypothetical protein
MVAPWPKSQAAPTTDLATLIRQWQLPEELGQHYINNIGITNLYPWQVTALSL